LAVAKQFIVVAGPNGSGKTTFAEEYLAQHAFSYLSADSIAANLSPGAPERARIAAGRRFLEELDRQLRAEESILVESTLSGRTFERFLAAAREGGFTSTIVMLFLNSPEACLARVRQRVRNGGHDVPELEVRRRFHRSLRNFWRSYRFLADDWVLVYNAGDDFQDIALGAGESISVRDENLFGQFVTLTGSGK
jgi:predicted ABC-type ATPase